MLSTGLVWSARPAQAQCGSSASSCKTCHETQGQDPVNTEGEWHTQHAFGDFCEFCHAGNVHAAEKEAAHQGLAAPLDDIAASCQGCHPQDLNERGEQYAAILGVSLDGGSAGDNGSDDDSSGDGNTGSNEHSNAPVAGIAAPLGGEEIDYNLLYAESMAPKPLISNWGNVILILMIVAVAAAFFLTAWSWEGWGKLAADWINDNVKVISNAAIEAGESANETGSAPAASPPTPAELSGLFERKPELKTLWPKLAGSDTRLLQDLNQILNDDEQGPKLLHAVSRLDLKLVTALKQLHPKERDLLLAVAREI